MTETKKARRDSEIEKAAGADRALASLIRTRAKQVKGEKPPPDLQRSRGAIKDAEMRWAWAYQHRRMAERHRATLTALIRHHEAAADCLAEGG